MTTNLLDIERELPVMPNDRLIYLIEHDFERVNMCMIEFRDIDSTPKERSNYINALTSMLLTEAFKRWRKLLYKTT